jgi:hypothetical protein
MPRVQNPSYGSGASPLLSTTTHLTAAQLLTLDSVPVAVTPAAPAGLLVIVIGAALVFDYGTVQYQPLNSDMLSLQYAGSENDEALAFPGGILIQNQSGAGYASGDYNGAGGILPGDDANAVEIINANSLDSGPIVTTTLGAGGLGYAMGDTGIINAGPGTATYTILTVGAGGAVLTYSITAPGIGYSVANGVATSTGGAQPGVGVGFTVNITAVQTGNGTLKVVTYYQIIPVP